MNTIHERIACRIFEMCLAVHYIQLYAQNITDELCNEYQNMQSFDAILMRLISIGESAYEIYSDFKIKKPHTLCELLDCYI